MSKSISVSVASQLPMKNVSSIHTIEVPKKNEIRCSPTNTNPVKQGLEDYPWVCVSWGNGI